MVFQAANLAKTMKVLLFLVSQVIEAMVFDINRMCDDSV